MNTQTDRNLRPLVDDPALAVEVKQLGDKLSARHSVVAFACGFVLICVGVVVLGVAVKLLAESSKLPFIFWPIAVAGLGCVVGSVVFSVKARHLQLSERAEFARYRELRARAGLDA